MCNETVLTTAMRSGSSSLISCGNIFGLPYIYWWQCFWGRQTTLHLLLGDALMMHRLFTAQGRTLAARVSNAQFLALIRNAHTSADFQGGAHLASHIRGLCNVLKLEVVPPLSIQCDTSLHSYQGCTSCPGLCSCRLTSHLLGLRMSCSMSSDTLHGHDPWAQQAMSCLAESMCSIEAAAAASSCRGIGKTRV